MHDQTAKNLQSKREALIDRFVAGKAKGFQKKHTRLMDEYFIESFEKSLVGPRMHIYKKPYAIIALGGYGRGEQCVSSDIDLLFLFKQQVPTEAEELIREIIYPLWDMGFEVGHATRSLRECIQLAGHDLDVFTSLLDARFICGMSPLYTELRDRLASSVIRGKARKITSWLIESNRERHDRFGDSSYRLEPNLKEGQGGLRDYHTMLWIARLASKLKTPRDLEYYGHLSHDEYRHLQKALAFIWKVRNHLHLLNGRKYDQLHFEHQQTIAGILKFKGAYGQLPVERFLGELHAQMEFIKQRNLIFLAEMGYRRNSFVKRRFAQKKSGIPGIEVDRNLLNFSQTENILASPDLLLKIFEESARLKIPLSSEAKRIVKEFLYLVNAEFRKSPANLQIFERILMTPATDFNVLNEFLNTGFLVRYIPEMKSILNHIQFDEYHLYPVDRHMLFTVRTLKAFAKPDPGKEDTLCHKLFKEIGNQKKFLLWAALLHDIGKGEEGKGHSERGAETAAKILHRFGYEKAEVDLVHFLVKEHLLLAKTASRRDTNDEETAVHCARQVGDVKRLKMLYLLTVADSISTGPKAWNEWTAALLRDLFFKTLKTLELGELATIEAVEEVQRKKEKIRSMQPEEVEAVNRHLDILSPRYLLYVPVEDILLHRRLYERLATTKAVWHVEKDHHANTRTVTICAQDRPGLFSRIAGVLTLNNLDILNAQIYTWKNNTALDIFTVTPPQDLIFEDERWARAEKQLISALQGELDLNRALAKRIAENRPAGRRTQSASPRVVIDNETSSFFTIFEVFADDQPGLLFQITNLLFNRQLDVRIAKIATKIDQVVDVFYVRDLEGQKLDDPSSLEGIKSAIETELTDVYAQAV